MGNTGACVKVLRNEDLSLLTAFPPVDVRDPRHPLPSIRVLHVHNVAVRPVQVVGDEGYLLSQLTKGVAKDSPEVVSRWNLWLHSGQTTICAAPSSWLMLL